MRALEFNTRPIFRSDYPEPAAGPGEAVVAVRRAGICRTDIEITRGYMDFHGVLGHEFVGIVQAGPREWKGKRVVAEINCVCGQCDLCTGGLRNHCRHRTVLGIQGRDGAFADRLAVPVRNLHEVPAGVSDDQAVFVEPLAAAFEVTSQVHVDAGHRAVVLGDGRLGQLVARVLQGRCGQLVLVGRHEAKLELAERVGIQTALEADFLARGDADVVVDATGSAEGFRLAGRAVRPRGTIVLKSTFAGDQPLNLANLVIDEVTVVGSRCGPFGEALRALARGEVDVTNLIGRHLPLERAEEALALAAGGDVIKVVLDVHDDCGHDNRS